MPLGNDTRGWVMAAVSGIACTVGASIICVDLIVRQFPGQKHFKIENSNLFLSSGLGLSFGVMIFSSLYSMLPEAKHSLQKGGMESKPAAFTLIVCFLIGATGISILSRILHRFISHSVVDCDHEHGDEEEGKIDDDQMDSHHHHHHPQPMAEQPRQPSNVDGIFEEHEAYPPHPSNGGSVQPAIVRRPSLHMQISSKVSQLVSGSKELCDENGQCFGYSDPCGQACFRNVQQAQNPRVHPITGKPPTRALSRTQTAPHERQPLLQGVNEPAIPTSTPSSPPPIEPPQETPPTTHTHTHSAHPPLNRRSSTHTLSSYSTTSLTSSHTPSHPTRQHHHHVPTNIFLSIGLQTSTAIALHKIPEGFITYATNHANPRLGFSIFLALFVHNITEGFALALPLYLAINSRWKAMFWSALLGGVSQPLGAAVAALWFRVAKQGEGAEPGDRVYGCLFAVTAGIMAMVSLQLFGESLDLTHSRKVCFASAVAGMGVLGVSSALTA